MASMPAHPAPVTVGVDTHADSHVAAVVDQTGRVLGSASFAASTRGYVALVNWAERLGPVAKIGIEGTGTYGAGLARFARAYGLRSSRLIDPTAGPAAAWASPTRLTPRPPLEPPCLGWPPRPLRPVRDKSR